MLNGTRSTLVKSVLVAFLSLVVIVSTGWGNWVTTTVMDLKEGEVRVEQKLKGIESTLARIEASVECGKQ